MITRVRRITPERYTWVSAESVCVHCCRSAAIAGHRLAGLNWGRIPCQRPIATRAVDRFPAMRDTARAVGLISWRPFRCNQPRRPANLRDRAARNPVALPLWWRWSWACGWCSSACACWPISGRAMPTADRGRGAARVPNSTAAVLRLHRVTIAPRSLSAW